MIPFTVPELEGFENCEPVKDEVELFEDNFKDYIGTDYAITFSSARYCMKLIYNFYKVLKVGIQAYTCIPAIDSIRWANAKPVFFDINKDYNIKLEKKDIDCLTSTYLYGNIGDVKEVKDYCKDKKIIWVEDAAIALGGEYKNKKVGSFGNAGVFSLQSSKMITGWKGGVITTNDKKLYNYLEKIRNAQKEMPKGRLALYLRYTLFNAKYPKVASEFNDILIKSGIRGESIHGKSPLEMPRELDYKFSDKQAMLANHGLSFIDRILEKRKEIADYYNERLNLAEKKSCYGRFPVKVLNNKYQLKRNFKEYGVDIGLNYPYICPETQYIDNEEYFPNASSAANHTILLPMFSTLTRSEQDSVIETFQRFVT